MKKQAGHTPGPWEINKDVGIREKDLFIWEKWDPKVAPGHAVACVYGFWPNVQANARLIAAAPDLLDACVDFVEAIEGYEQRTGNFQHHLSLEKARAAIAKVKG